MPLPTDYNPTRLTVTPDWQDQEAQANASAMGLPIAQQPAANDYVAQNWPSAPTKDSIIQQILGTGQDERYQLWPEKLIRDALSAPHDVLTSKTPLTSQDLIKPAMDISALAGTGGLGGTGEAAGTSLGAGPFLRPALKYEGRIYKAPMGGQHMDAIPQDLQPEFTRQAMSGEDISNFNFGFMNHKSQFLDRQKALDYAVENGLLDPHDARYGALTSTMDLRADSSKEAAALDAAHNEGLSYLLSPKSKATGIGEETGKFNPDGFSTFKVNAPSGYLGDRIVYSKNGKILGAMQITKTPNGKPTVANTYVSPDVRRTGIASKLNNEAIKKYGELDRSEGPSQAGQAFRDSLLRSDNPTGAAIGALEKSGPFFSAAEKAVDAIPQAKMTGGQWLGTIANKPGVKPEELDWTGLKSYLETNKDKAVTKTDIQEHLKNNKVEVSEVNKGGDVQVNPKTFYENATQGQRLPDWSQLSQRERQHWVDEADKNTTGNTKYHDYQLPGGENYREKLLTLPKTTRDMTAPTAAASAKYMKEWDALVAEDRRLRPLVDDYNRRLTGSEWEKAKADLSANSKKMDDLHDKMVDDTIASNPAKYGPEYKSSHWDEPNILAHMRMNDRTIEGKKSLHLEEIQSDWHQQGRDKGYKQDVEKLPIMQEIRNLGIKYPWERISPKAIEEAGGSKELADRWAKEMPSAEGVPNAPFKKSWHELALKRAIYEAANNGYDRLSWTPGEAQAARYDLSKQVDTIQATKLPDGTYNIHARPKNDAGFETIGSRVSEDKLSDIVGKELAKKIASQETDKASSYKGLDLKIGGEGMKGFYDKMIPNAVEKLLKEHGVKVKSADLGEKALTGLEVKKAYTNAHGEDIYSIHDNSGKLIETDFKSKRAAEDALIRLKYKENKSVPVHYIEIPQSLKNQAKKGFPLFSTGLPIPNEDKK